MDKVEFQNWVQRGFEWEDLRFIRVYDLNLIPRALLEQVKNRDLEVDMMYEAGDAICSNPFNIIYAIATQEDAKIVGMLWIMLNPLESSLWGQILTLDKDYQNRGITPFITERLIALRDALGMKKVKCITTRPRALERVGFKKSKAILMEV